MCTVGHSQSCGGFLTETFAESWCLMVSYGPTDPSHMSRLVNLFLQRHFNVYGGNVFFDVYEFTLKDFEYFLI